MNKNYEITDIGTLDTLKDNSYILPDSKKTITGKMFLNDFVKLTGCEISFNAFIPGQFVPFDHKHIDNEETFIFLSGHGECEVDGEKIEVHEGSVINMQPNAVRNLCNTSADSILTFIVIQTKKDSMNSVELTKDGIGVAERTEW